MTSLARIDEAEAGEATPEERADASRIQQFLQ